MRLTRVPTIASRQAKTAMTSTRLALVRCSASVDDTEHGVATRGIRCLPFILSWQCESSHRAREEPDGCRTTHIDIDRTAQSQLFEIAMLPMAPAPRTKTAFATAAKITAQ